MKNIIAAFIFFTRLPIWQHKMFHLEAKYFENVINYWAVTAWLTAGVMAGTLWVAAQFLPLSVAVIIAMVARIWLTGALHEDGLADFFDGMGGGHTKAQILRIMKDSFIGTYGVLALIIYYLIFFNILIQFNLQTVVLLMLVADPLAKFISSNITLLLPYARTNDTSKSGVVYRKMQPIPFVLSAVFGLLPMLLLLEVKMWWAVIAPVLLFFVFAHFLNKKIGGYTGDTCGALFLLSELVIWIAFLVINQL